MATATTEPEHYTTQYGTNWDQRVQQVEARLRGHCRVETVDGKEKTFNQIGATSMTLISSRTQETVATPGTYRKRFVRTLPYENTRWFDEFDDTFLGAVTLPDSDTVRSQASAYNRQCDQVSIDNWLGTNYEGETGGNSVSFLAANQIANGSAGLTTAKLITARELLSTAEAFNEDDPMDELVCVITATQVSDLMGDDEFKNADYNTVKALVEGKPTTWLGFKFIRTELLPVANSIRSCIAYVKSGAVLGMDSRAVDIARRKDRSNAIQVRTVGLLGATRLEEEKFVQIDCLES